MLESTLRLFNAVQIENQDGKMHNPELLPRMLRNGYVLGPGVIPTAKLLATIEGVIGISGEKANNAFHKSWAVVRDSKIETLIVQQMIHYITTYGFEAAGIFDREYVYIPVENLEIPGVSEGLRLVVIHGLTKMQLLTKIVDLAGSGIALSKQTIADIMAIVKYNEYTDVWLPLVKNNELKMVLYDHFGLAPSDPMEYLRYLIFRLTGESLVIKNGKLITMLKAVDQKKLDELLLKAPAMLPSIFFRYKPLFLALKKASKNKRFFNQMRKAANEMHRPLPTDYLNSITDQVQKGALNTNVLKSFLKQSGIFRKIRLAYALKYRTMGSNSIVYRVRNGKGWVTPFSYKPKQSLDIVLGNVLESIAQSIEPNVSGKMFYIPEGVTYCLPATEKAMVGNIPSGSSVSVKDGLVVGIHWTNIQERRVDLDFKVMSLYSTYGWDSSYRSGDREVMFSGDMTDAPLPKGASELFFVGKKTDPMTVYISDFNRYSGEDVVPCSFFVADAPMPTQMYRSYMVDPNKIRATTKFNIVAKETTVGIIINGAFYFYNVSTGNKISARNDSKAKMALEHLVISAMSGIDLDPILWAAGATVVNIRPESGEYVDLSPESLTKTTFLDILTQ